MPNLVHELGLNLLPEPEGRILLGEFFGRIGQVGERPERTGYYGRGEQQALLFRYNKKGRLHAVEPGPDFDRAEVAQIRARIESVASEQARTICREVIFGQVKTFGFWRYRDSFQLLPPPVGAPAPNTAMGDYPVVLEFSVPKADGWGLRDHRRRNTIQETVLLLAALSGQWFDFIPVRRPDKQWVAFPDGDAAGRWRYIFASVNYWIDDFQAVTSQFTDPSGAPPIDLLPAPEGRVLKRSDDHDGLALIDTLADSLDRFFALSADDRDRFLRSAYWLHHARKVFSLSKSASLVALVQAVETLATTAPDLKCDKCGGVREYGPTRAFREFIGRYVPDIDDKDREVLYTARSAITHGELVLSDDLGSYLVTSPKPSDVALDDTQYDAWRAARLGVNGWLCDNDRPS